VNAAATRLRRAAYREWGALAGDVREALTRDGWRAVPLTVCCVVLIGALQAAQHTGRGEVLVRRAGVVDAAQPWWRALLRTPLSLFVPAPDLPVWGAMAQVLVVFGIAETTLGRGRTLFVAYFSTLGGTVFARLVLAGGPPPLPGLGPADAFTRDTGPSAAVVALALCVAWRYRARWTCAAVVLAMAAEVVLFPDLAGWEHLAALAAAACCALGDDAARARRERKAGRPPVRCPPGGR
jgi:hypothetical protein